MPKERREKYGLWWQPLTHPVQIELHMIRHGGQWEKKDGSLAGLGLFHHFKALQDLLWPGEDWHKWRNLTLKHFIENRIIGVIGPASSAKTHDAALFSLCMYYAFQDCCTVLCSSTEREMLEMRVWGEIKKHHKLAKTICDWLPGQLTESRQRIMTDERFEDVEGRDFRNGLCGVPCKKGGNYVGLGSYIGIKNKIVMLVADEGQFLPKAYVDSISNLGKNVDKRGVPGELGGFKGIVLGNPKDTTDALGVICEPAAELGGWDGGIDQTGGTKTWPTRFPGGICIQLVGSDCPNMDVPVDAPVPFPYLITRDTINNDIAFYGRDSVQFSMMNDGRMPKGQGLRRVLTRQAALKFGAMEQPTWKGEERTRIGFLDAAYGRVGGDRCVFGEIQFGPGIDSEGKEKILLALIDTMVVPVSIKETELPEDQIANIVKAQCQARGIQPDNFFFDSTGRGTLMAAFARLWSPNVQPVEFGGKPTDRIVSNEIRTLCMDYYSKFVSELWFSVRLCVESRQFRGLTEDALNEFCLREWKLIKNNKVEVESKEEMKVKMGRSPDIADAICAGLEGARRRGFVIQKLSKFIPRDTEGWKDNLRKRAEQLHHRGSLNYAA